jgi:putative hemolysin
MSAPWWLVVAIILCLIGNGFFSGAEIALLSVRKSRVEELIAKGSRAARRVKELQEHPETFLAAVQIGVTFMGTLAGVLGGYLASLFLEPALVRLGLPGWIGPSVAATFIVGSGIVYVELVLGELLPKALALRFTDVAARVAAIPVSALARGSRWIIRALTGSTRAVLLLFGIKDSGHHTFVSEEEIKHLVKEGREQGVLDQTEMELIHSVFEFSETPVRKVMVPRPKIFALDAATPPNEVGSLIVESGFSRIPAYEGSVDNIIGVVYVKDVLRLLEKRQPVVLRKVLHPVHFVPETKKTGLLLKELQKRRSHMAIVIDEHGSVTGLVTMEDLLEEIVGPIEDEYDWEERQVEKLRDGALVVDGTLSAAELREAHHVPIPESGEFETVAGFMLSSLGVVPKGGEVVPVGDYRFTVVDVEKNRISKVKIEKAPAPVAANALRGRS